MSATKNRPDSRTPAQLAADEEIATQYERYLVKDAATGWTIHEATDARRSLAAALANDPNNAIAPGGLEVPFLWNGKAFRITRASHQDGVTLVATTPPDAAFEAELLRRIDAAPSRVLTFFQGFGFVCFPEDYAKYQG